MLLAELIVLRELIKVRSTPDSVARRIGLDTHSTEEILERFAAANQLTITTAADGTLIFYQLTDATLQLVTDNLAATTAQN